MARNQETISPKKASQVFRVVEQVTSSSTNCFRCGGFMYPLERFGPILNNLYHKTCFRCSKCDISLNLKNYCTNSDDLKDRQVYCTKHAPKPAHLRMPYEVRSRKSQDLKNQESPNPGLNKQISEIDDQKQLEDSKYSRNLSCSPKSLRRSASFTESKKHFGWHPTVTNEKIESSGIGWENMLNNEQDLVQKNATQFNKSSSFEGLVVESPTENVSKAQEPSLSIYESKSDNSETELNDAIKNVGLFLDAFEKRSSKPVLDEPVNALSQINEAIMILDKQAKDLDPPFMLDSGNEDQTEDIEEIVITQKNHTQKLLVDKVLSDREPSSKIENQSTQSVFPSIPNMTALILNTKHKQINDNSNSSTSSRFGVHEPDTNIETSVRSGVHLEQASTSTTDNINILIGKMKKSETTGSANMDDSEQVHKSIETISDSAPIIKLKKNQSYDEAILKEDELVSEPIEATKPNLSNINNMILNMKHKTPVIEVSEPKSLALDNINDLVKKMKKREDNCQFKADDDASEPSLDNINILINRLKNKESAKELQEQPTKPDLSIVSVLDSKSGIDNFEQCENTKPVLDNINNLMFNMKLKKPDAQTLDVSKQILNDTNEGAINDLTVSSQTYPFEQVPVPMARHKLNAQTDNKNDDCTLTVAKEPIQKRQSVLNELAKAIILTTTSFDSQTTNTTANQVTCEQAPVKPDLESQISDLSLLIDNIAKMSVVNAGGSLSSNNDNKDKGYGQVRLSVSYSSKSIRLSIIIHEAKNLHNTDKKGLSDPYARIFLLPDDKKITKRNTKVIKNNLNPKWEEKFDYTMTLEEACARVLYINLKDEKGVFERQETQFLGEVFLKLNTIDIVKGFSGWLWLQPKS